MTISQQNDRSPPKRRYPPLYERLVPIALGIVALAIVVLLLVIICVALGFCPGPR